MKNIMFILLLFVLLGCGTKKFAVEYRQSSDTNLIDSVANAENWLIPSYKDWNYSVYLGVANGDTTIVKVYNFYNRKNKRTFIFSVTEINDAVSQVNFRKE